MSTLLTESEVFWRRRLILELRLKVSSLFPNKEYFAKERIYYHKQYYETQRSWITSGHLMYQILFYFQTIGS